jgi:hypothetical protein
LAALTTPRCLVCEAAARPFANVVRFGRCNFGAEAFLFLVVLFLVVLVGALAEDFAAAATRFGFEPPVLVFTAALRLETLAALVDLADVLLGARAGLLILAETLASLLFEVELDFDNRLIAFAGRLDDFFGVFFRADMADLLPKPNASNLR